MLTIDANPVTNGFKSEVIDILNEIYGDETKAKMLLNSKTASKIIEIYSRYTGSIVDGVTSELRKIRGAADEKDMQSA